MSVSTEDSRGTPRTKKELRRELRERIRALAPEAARRAAERVAERVLTLPELAEARGVLTCLSFGDEMDTWGLVDGLLAAGKEVLVPRADPEDRRLHLHRYPCELETLSFGLRQPPQHCAELPGARVDEEVGAALVLGLGFDHRGVRLGYGGGYFDRFFGEHRLLAIGLAYEVQLVDRLPTEAHDVPMDMVVTEERVLRFEGTVAR